MNQLRLHAALLLSLLAAVAALDVGPSAFRVVAVGLFVLAAPGLLLTHLLRIGDALLATVVGMITGPVVWVCISTIGVFTGLWAPVVTILGAAGLVAVAALLLLRQGLREDVDPLDASRHRFSAHLADEVEIRAVGRHRGAFPSPYDG